MTFTLSGFANNYVNEKSTFARGKGVFFIWAVLKSPLWVLPSQFIESELYGSLSPSFSRKQTDRIRNKVNQGSQVKPGLFQSKPYEMTYYFTENSVVKGS